MFKKYPLITGTLILTATGILSRIIGFFYRIFLSQTIGEEGMGIYQLIAPVMVLSFSLTAAGIQTAISKFAAPEPSTKNYGHSVRILLSGLAISLTLSCFASYILYTEASFIAKNLLLEARCQPLVRIYALSLPFGAIHSCINGYYYGIKKTAIPAISQLLEQSARVLSVYCIFAYCKSHSLETTISISVIGIVIGEILSMGLSAIAVLLRFHKLGLFASYCNSHNLSLAPAKHPGLFKTGRDILGMAIPLSGNRLIINLLQSVEAVYIPNKLMVFGLSNSDVLRIYGVLTGMVLPLILFPTALTGSIAVLLLPYVSEAQASNNYKKISQALSKCLYFCLGIGFLCGIFFFLFGNVLGEYLFDSEMAGTFIRTISFICPFLYLRNILMSVVHGLGQTGRSFIFQIIGNSCKLAFVFLAIPVFGINGYLWGLLVSELLFCALYITSLRKYILVK